MEQLIKLTGEGRGFREIGGAPPLHLLPPPFVVLLRRIMFFCSYPAPDTMKCGFVLFVVFYRVFQTTFTQVPDYETTSQPLPVTSFTCQGRPPGYYADVETGCKTYHVCDGNSHFTYICPRRTLFQQKMRICDHSYLVNCDESYLYDDEEEFYSEEIEEKENQLKDNPEIETIEENTTLEPVTVVITPRPKPTTATESPFTSLRTSVGASLGTSLGTSVGTSLGTSVGTSLGTTATATKTIQIETTPTTEITPQTSKKYLKLHLQDLRSLFFIPEIDDNSIVRKPIAEYLIPVETEMKFKRRYYNSPSSCPRYCNSKYFVPGTCHPCIMLK